jgi:hypothetical protein
VTGESTNLLRGLVGVLANVSVLTGLLVYFGWRRVETQAQRLGIDESILGLSTRDYVLRSVGPVLALLVGIAVVGLLWLWVDRRLMAWVVGRRDRRATLVVGAAALGWLLLPLLVVAGAGLWPRGAFVVFPASIGAGVLLLLHADRLRVAQRGEPSSHQPWVRVFVVIVVGVSLFWTASNYAEVLGTSLAKETTRNVRTLTGVVAYSKERLHLDAPGAIEQRLPGDDGYRYRYRGLRLLDHTGGRWFLVSEDWSPLFGVVVALADDDDSIRLEFVRDRRPVAATERQ